MPTEHPTVIVLAGPNGSGKTTAAPKLLRDALGVLEFVNADTIAQGLAAFRPELVALEAGAIMLSRMRQLADKGRDFAFETTLASRSLAPWLAGLIDEGYEFHLVYLWLPSADLAVARVADRVRMGGHSVPEETIRRRYWAGLRNFFRLYMPLATKWQMLDNSHGPGMHLIASGSAKRGIEPRDANLWAQLTKEYSNA